MSEAVAPQRFIQIDEEGYFLSGETRISDTEYGEALLKSLRIDEKGRAILTADGAPIIVEAFDEPFVARSVSRDSGPNDAVVWTLCLPYGHVEPFKLETLCLDEWDRFHGRTESGVPFVFSRSAQAEFFNLVDDYDDDSVSVNGFRYEMKPWLLPEPSVSLDAFWTEIYQTEDPPGFELGKAHDGFQSALSKLKLNRSRILVLGTGTGNDAAFFARQGHLVTAVDFSPEAITRAQKKYGTVEGLKFIQADAFALPSEMRGAFDVVIEHTLYCAIDPSRRNELVRVWRQCLADDGHLLAIFFVTEKRTGPPFGGTEWELRSRLTKSFRPLIWQRLRVGDARLGKEVLIYAQKLSRDS